MKTTYKRDKISIPISSLKDKLRNNKKFSDTIIKCRSKHRTIPYSIKHTHKTNRTPFYNKTTAKKKVLELKVTDKPPPFSKREPLRCIENIPRERKSRARRQTKEAAEKPSYTGTALAQPPRRAAAAAYNASLFVLRALFEMRRRRRRRRRDANPISENNFSSRARAGEFSPGHARRRPCNCRVYRVSVPIDEVLS